MDSKRLCGVLPVFGYGRTHLFGKQDFQLLGRSHILPTLFTFVTYPEYCLTHLKAFAGASQIMHRSLISKYSSLKSIPLVIKLLMSAIVSCKNSRFDGLEIPTVNVIGKGLGGFKLQISPKTGHADVLLLLNKGSPSMFKDSINLLLRA